VSPPTAAEQALTVPARLRAEVDGLLALVRATLMRKALKRADKELSKLAEELERR
jgi:hypothetical protein